MAPCRAIHTWSLWSLVTAYVDLALAYIFLSVAACAFVAAKLLSVLGLSLPCTCTGADTAGRVVSAGVGSPDQHRCRHRQRDSGARCLQGRLLVDYPAAKIAGVRFSARQFLFGDCLCHHNHHHGYDVQVFYNSDESDRDDDYGGPGRSRAPASALLKMGTEEGEESCGSVSNAKLSLPGPQAEAEDVGSSSTAAVGLKGKGVYNGERPIPFRHRRRLRPRNNLSNPRKPQLASRSPPPRLVWQVEEVAGTPIAGSQLQQGESKESATAVNRFSGNQSWSVEEGDSANEQKSTDDKDDEQQLFGAKLVDEAEMKESMIIINELKQMLLEEQSLHAALSLELEKERSAAATAADEAIAMIAKIQEQKALIEMEARQYRRMVEEKSTYDDEEMEILKEIIIRREKEKHWLEKEVERYRGSVASGGSIEQLQWGTDLHDGAQLSRQSTVRSSDDPEFLLKEVYRSIEKKENENDKMQIHCDSGPLVAEYVGYSINVESEMSGNMEKHHREMLDHQEDCNVEEKGMLTMEAHPDSFKGQSSSYKKEPGSHELNGPQDSGVYEPLPGLVHEGDLRDRKMRLGDPLDDLYARYGPNTDKTCPEAPHLDSDASVLDVHVIDDKLYLAEGSKSQIDFPPMGHDSGSSHMHGVTNELSASNTADHLANESDEVYIEVEPHIQRSISDVTKIGQPMNSSGLRDSWLDMRNSMSEVDSERSILENEVEFLRKRLKIIQQGREKLRLSEQKEKEKYHLRLLEEIANQLKEIRESTIDGKSSHHGSLSPSSSTANLKRRRCRSEGLNDST